MNRSPVWKFVAGAFVLIGVCGLLARRMVPRRQRRRGSR